MGFFDKITEQVSDITSIIRRVSAIEGAISSIENWRHQQADPNISSNIKNITTATSNIETMYQNIKSVASRVEALPEQFETHLRDVVAPEITSNMRTTLTTYVDDMIDDLKDKITTWVIGFVGDPSIPLINQTEGTILSFLHTAQSKAELAITSAKSIFDRLQIAATQLKSDADAVGGASGELLNSMAVEMEAIKQQFVSFGAKVYESAELIGKNLGYAGKELEEAYVQIKLPLDMVNIYAKRCRDDNIVFLPYNIFMTLYWGFLK